MSLSKRLRPSVYQLHNALGKPVLSKTLALLPFRLKQAVLQRVLNSAFQQAIEDGEFDFLVNRTVALRINDLGQVFNISFEHGFMLKPPSTNTDLQISGNLDEFVTLALRKEDPDTLFFQRRITVEGDTELGLTVKNLIDAVDLEELPTAFQKGLGWCNSLYPLLQPQGGH